MGQRQSSRSSSALSKRLIDISLSLPVVLVILPLLAVLVRLGQWLQSPGPLFFRQKRRGQFGTTFTILKFRTMDVPVDGASEVTEDPIPRIFPVGRFLRNTKLDEIPQFVNVLLGAMSVVGPRPHHLHDCEAFERLVDGYAQRTVVKPGITGLAQITEYRGDFEWNCVESRVEKDLAYIRDWRLRKDLLLIGSTVLVVSRHVMAGVLRRLTGGLFHPRPTPEPSVVSMSESAPGIVNTQAKLNDRKAA